MNGRTLPHETERLVVEQAGANRKGDKNGPRKRYSRSRSVERRSPRGVASNEDVCYNCNKGGHW